jgi:hypothetical protein
MSAPLRVCAYLCVRAFARACTHALVCFCGRVRAIFVCAHVRAFAVVCLFILFVLFWSLLQSFFIVWLSIRAAAIRSDLCFCLCAVFISLQHLMRVRAGVVAWGVKGSNSCPAGTYAIVDLAQCRYAAETANTRWEGTEDTSFMPRGCYWTFASIQHLLPGVILNKHPTGLAIPLMQPLCAVGTGVSVGVRARVHVRVSVNVHV